MGECLSQGPWVWASAVPVRPFRGSSPPERRDSMSQRAGEIAHGPAEFAVGSSLAVGLEGSEEHVSAKAPEYRTGELAQSRQPRA